MTSRRLAAKVRLRNNRPPKWNGLALCVLAGAIMAIGRRSVMQEKQSRDTAQLHRAVCAGIEEAARAKLGRPLTRDEIDKIWNCGSFMHLEQIEMAIHVAATPAEVEKFLAEFPFLGPLPPEFTARD